MCDEVQACMYLIKYLVAYTGGCQKKGAPMKKRVSYVKKLKGHGISVNKFPTLVAHNFRIQIEVEILSVSL